MVCNDLYTGRDALEYIVALPSSPFRMCWTTPISGVQPSQVAPAQLQPPHF